MVPSGVRVKGVGIFVQSLLPVFLNFNALVMVTELIIADAG